MLLETLDIKKNDIIIYSKNIFDFEKNFRIIYKDNIEIKSYRIDYSDVCKHVSDFVPQNLIVYRLLTNMTDFTLSKINYGFAIYINGVKEVVYFDPIFAVKELENIFNEEELPKLRFRIQQVGLSTINRRNNLANYAEIYSIDLEAIEAKFQNDKVFVDALYSINKNKSSLHKIDSIQKSANKNVRNVNRKENKKDNKQNEHIINEDVDFDYQKLKKINHGKTFTKEVINGKGKNVRVSIEKEVVKNDIKIPSAISTVKKKKITMNELINKSNSKTEEKIGKERISYKENHLIEIFKSTDTLKKLMQDKENKRVVLKLNKK